jgi:hypothetical protein
MLSEEDVEALIDNLSFGFEEISTLNPDQDLGSIEINGGVVPLSPDFVERMERARGRFSVAIGLCETRLKAAAEAYRDLQELAIRERELVSARYLAGSQAWRETLDGIAHLDLAHALSAAIMTFDPENIAQVLTLTAEGKVVAEMLTAGHFDGSPFDALAEFGED